MGTHQMSERQVIDALLAEAVRDVFEEYVTEHGLGEIAEIFATGVRIEVGDTLPERALCRVAQARAAGVGEGVRGERQRERGGAGELRGVRAGGVVGDGSDLAGGAAWAGGV